MQRIVYLSAATEPFSDQALDDLLAISRRNNQEQGLTGLLVYRDGDFLQILEGEPAAVEETFQRISRDPRHARVIVLDESEVGEREFTAWSMGFRRADRGACPEGFVDFFNRRFDPASLVERGQEALQFLRSFRDLGH